MLLQVFVIGLSDHFPLDKIQGDLKKALVSIWALNLVSDDIGVSFIPTILLGSRAEVFIETCFLKRFPGGPDMRRNVAKKLAEALEQEACADPNRAWSMRLNAVRVVSFDDQAGFWTPRASG